MREGVKVIYIFFNSLRVRVHVFINCSEKLFLLEDLQGCFTGSHGPEGRGSKPLPPRIARICTDGELGAMNV